MTWRPFHWWNQLHQMAQPKPTRLNPFQSTLCIEDNVAFKSTPAESTPALYRLDQSRSDLDPALFLMSPEAKQILPERILSLVHLLGPNLTLLSYNSLQAEARKNIISPHPLGVEEPWNCLGSESESSMREV
ncbi:hypothetical protein CR513_35664, partial [Mucuna pruriens]